MPEPSPHYLVITAGSHGDIHPFISMARSLQAMGRAVTFITGVYHANLVRSAGIDCLGMGTDEDYLRVIANPGLWDPRKGFSVLLANYGDHLRQMDEAIRSIASRAPLVAIVHPLAVAGAAMARECGLVESIVAAYLAPSNIKTCHDPLQIGPNAVPRWVPMRWRRAFWRFLEKGWIDPVPVAQINALREAKALPKVHSFLGHMAEAPDLSVTLFPGWFAPAVPDWPSPLVSGDFPLFDARTGEDFAPALAAFLAAGDRPVVFTPGTGNIHAADFFASALAAVDKLGRRAVFLTRERAQVPAQLPASVLWQAYVPLSALLPHAAALVHHGGIGTTAEALRAGTPQLVAPFAWDQFDNGARIIALGAGMVMPAHRLRPGRLARSLDALITPDTFRTRCAELASRFTPPDDPTALCREIERLALAKRDARP